MTLTAAITLLLILMRRNLSFWAYLLVLPVYKAPKPALLTSVSWKERSCAVICSCPLALELFRLNSTDFSLLQIHL